MADTDRPTRWQKARDDWPGFQRRDPIVGAVALVLAIVGLLVVGRPGEAVEEALIVGGAAVLATVLYPLGQLVWAWLQAPMRLLTTDVIAIRERLEAAPRVPAEKPFDMRISLLNSIRLGEQLKDKGLIYSGDLEAWITPVVTMLTEHANPADAELFLKQKGLANQLDVLRKMLEKYPR